MGRGTEVPTYQQGAQYNATISPNVPQGSPASFGTSIAREQAQMGDNLSKLGAVLANHAVKMQEQADNAFVIQQENDFRQKMNTLMYDPNAGLAKAKGYNAQGATMSFDGEADKQLQEYMNNMNPVLKSKFLERTNSWLPQYRNIVAKNEGDELYNARLGDFNTSIDLKINDSLNVAGVQGFKNLFSSLDYEAKSLMSVTGMSYDTAKQYVVGKFSNAYVDKAKVMSDSGDVQGLLDLTNAAEGKVNADSMAKVAGMIGPVKNKMTGHKVVDDLIATGNFNNSNGTLNKAALQNAIAAQFGPDAIRDEQVLIPGSTGGDITANLHSGMAAFNGTTMDYKRVGCVEAVTKVGSYYSPFLKDEFDKGVVNTDNLRDDARKKGIAEVAFSEDNLQPGDTVVYDNGEHVLIYIGNGKVFGNSSSARDDEYGAGQGPGMVKEQDIYQGQSPTSILKTSQQANGAGTPDHYETKSVSAYNPDVYAAAMQYAEQQANNIKYQHDTTVQNGIDNLLKQYPPGSLHSWADIQSAVASAGYDGQDAVTVANGLAPYMNMERSDQNQAWTQESRARTRENWAYEDKSKEAAQWLIDNPNATEIDFIEAWGEQGLNPKEKLSILSSIAKASAANDPYAWNKGENRATFENATSSYKLTGLEKNNVRNKITAENMRRKEAGEPPLTSSEITGMVQNGSAEIVVKRGWISDNKAKDSDIPAGYTRTDSGVVDESGNNVTYNPDTQQWERY